jgi:hypothetical protein
MNTEVILSNIKEAEEELRALIARLEKSPNYPFEDFHVSMAHLYHHLNTAWNARNATRQRYQACSDEDYHRWECFPNDLPLIGDDAFYDLPEYRDANEP